MARYRVNSVEHDTTAEPPFTKWTDVLLQDHINFRRREIRVETFSITLKFDRHLGGNDAEMPAKFQSNTIIISPDLVTSSLHDIFR